MLLQHLRSAPLLHHLRPKLSPFSLSPSISLPISFTLSFQVRFRARALSTSVNEQSDINSDTESYFFAPDEVSWKSLGISDRLSQSLCNSGLHKPSLVQAACIPHILEGKDVVIAAETGSGKTHGYLAPLIDKLCAISNQDPSNEDKSNDNVSKNNNLILVLCPNVMLSEQVVNMANSLVNQSGELILKVSAVCGQKGWPIVQPDVIVSTPAALLNYLCEYDPERRRRERFLRHVKFVVFDEADMLLCGSFQNQVIRLIHMLRFDEKLLSRLNCFNPNGPHHQQPSQESVTESYEDLLEASITDELQQAEEDEEEESGDEEQQQEGEGVVLEGSGRSRRRDWRRVRKMYQRSKQYVFVAATLPQSGKKTAGGVLKRMFPEAFWVSGAHLHRHNPRLEQRWIEVTTDTQVDDLLEAVKYNTTNTTNNDVTRTMVFANTVDSANAICEILERAGIKCLLYHSETSAEEKAENIIEFKNNGGVFVCTDAAARGLDIPDISHVIQAEFASSAVDFLHRVGRTGRAGKFGVVTNLYTRSSRDLVKAVRRAEESNLPVEDAFSRKRSFRNKLKKRGRARMAEKPNVLA
ncbi:hypothetical protein LUZ60_003191 [Juncus effusus]|nr:hypothetical protein LUZ60_003191 [Juncus effusus]